MASGFNPQLKKDFDRRMASQNPAGTRNDTVLAPPAAEPEIKQPPGHRAYEFTSSTLDSFLSAFYNYISFPNYQQAKKNLQTAWETLYLKNHDIFKENDKCFKCDVCGNSPLGSEGLRPYEKLTRERIMSLAGAQDVQLKTEDKLKKAQNDFIHFEDLFLAYHYTTGCRGLQSLNSRIKLPQVQGKEGEAPQLETGPGAKKHFLPQVHRAPTARHPDSKPYELNAEGLSVLPKSGPDMVGKKEARKKWSDMYNSIRATWKANLTCPECKNSPKFFLASHNCYKKDYDAIIDDFLALSTAAQVQKQNLDDIVDRLYASEHVYRDLNQDSLCPGFYRKE